MLVTDCDLMCRPRFLDLLIFLEREYQVHNLRHRRNCGSVGGEGDVLELNLLYQRSTAEIGASDLPRLVECNPRFDSIAKLLKTKIRVISKIFNNPAI